MNIEVKTEWDETLRYDNSPYTKATLEEFNTYIEKIFKDTSKDNFVSSIFPKMKNNNLGDVFIGRR